MSEHFIVLIPSDPAFVPAPANCERAKELFTQFLPGAQHIEALLTDDVTFVDQGENFERVCCPGCSSELETVWWQDAMSKADVQKFRNLEIVTPCCAFSTTLNDLDYQWPAGFARFRLSARGPGEKQVSPDQLQQLGRLLGIKLRQIWARY